MRRIVLCEGPDDVAALCEIAQILGTSRIQGVPPGAAGQAPLGAGFARRAWLGTHEHPIEVKAIPGAKSQLAPMLRTELTSLAPQGDRKDPEAVCRIGVVYDPDEDHPSKFRRDVEGELAQTQNWTFQPRGPCAWTGRRADGGRLVVLLVDWRGPTERVDHLAEKQNIERLLVGVLRRTFPADALLVEAFLDDMHSKGKKLGWKAALHVWCALVDESLSEQNLAAQFLRQNKKCRPHAQALLEGLGLLDQLRPLLAPWG